MTTGLESVLFCVSPILQFPYRMKIWVFLSLLLSPLVTYGQCLPPEQIRQIVSNLQEYVVKVDVEGSEDDGSGFLLNSNLGVEAVTAHHVVVDDRGMEPTSCEDSDPPPSDPLKLLASTFHFHSSQGQPKLPIHFSNREPHFSVQGDLVKAPLPDSGFRGLEAQPADQPLAKGEGVIIAGFPLAKGRRFMQHLCEFKGYGEGLNTEKHSAYRLHCPKVGYDIAAMSGGIAISTCTGKVVGAVSYQNYHAKCPQSGDPRSVFIAPLTRNQAGQIAFGPPKVGPPAQMVQRLPRESATQFILGHGVR